MLRRDPEQGDEKVKMSRYDAYPPSYLPYPRRDINIQGSGPVTIYLHAYLAVK